MTHMEAMPKLGYRAPEAATYLGISQSKFLEMVKQGRMPKPCKIDGCTLWRADALLDAFNALTNGSAQTNPWDEAVGQN